MQVGSSGVGSSGLDPLSLIEYQMRCQSGATHTCDTVAEGARSFTESPRTVRCDGALVMCPPAKASDERPWV